MKVLIALVTLIPAFVFGQAPIKSKPRPFEDGYVIYGDDRRVETGQVQVPEKKRRLVKCNFRKSFSGIAREMQVGQIVGFGFDHGAVYQAVDFTHDSIPGKFFVKVLVDGNVSLYDDNEVLILRVESGVTTELNPTNYRDLLQAATVTCPAVNQLAQHLVFDPSVLADFIKGYNRCLEKDPATFDPFIEKPPFYMGVSAGFESTTLDTEALSFYPSFSAEEQNHFFAGLSFYFQFAKSQALELGLIYKQRLFDGTAQGIPPSSFAGERIHELTVSYTELLIPLTFRQVLWRKNRVTIHGTAGVAYPLLLNESSQIANRDIFSSHVYLFTIRPATFTKSIQYNIGVAVEITLRNEHRLSIQGSYLHGSATLMTYVGETGATVEGYSYFVGYTLW